VNTVSALFPIGVLLNGTLPPRLVSLALASLIPLGCACNAGADGPAWRTGNGGADSDAPGDTNDSSADDLSIVEDLPCPDPDVLDDVYTVDPEPGSQVVITVDTVDENGFDFICNTAYQVEPNPPWDDGGFFAEGDDDFDCSHGWEGSCPRIEFESPEGGFILFVWSWAWQEERWDECPGVPTPYRVQVTADGQPEPLVLVEDDIQMVPEDSSIRALTAAPLRSAVAAARDLPDPS